jgi:hypothetical protein
MMGSRILRDERGAVVMWTAVSLGVLVAFAGLTTDIPYLYVARQQAQTAADAGALAGANGLLLGTDQAVTDARAFARRTPIIGQSLSPGQVDVSLLSSAGSPTPDQVRCTTYRDATHGNPLPLFLLPILQMYGLGRTTADVSATATAQLSKSCGSDCFKPWSIADRWIDVNGNGKFDPGIDRYVPPGQPGATGYQYPADKGLQLTLKEGTPGGTIVPSFFNAVDFPPINRGTPITGAAAYRDNIATCAPLSFVAIGDQLQTEQGNMPGPTRQGVEALINQDPTAVWNPSCNCVDSKYGSNSPRLIRIPFFDPRFPPTPGRTSLGVANVGGFFLEDIRPNGDVVGRFTLVPSFGGAPAPPGAACTFLRTVQLVK